MNFVHQVECLLHVIRGTRKNIFLPWIIKSSISKLMICINMPLHLVQINELKTNRPETWNALKNGDFCVKKTGTPFTNLFIDQMLEQKIRDLKVDGGITGLTRNESALNRISITAPELSFIVGEFKESSICLVLAHTSKNSTVCQEHHQCEWHEC